MKENEIKRCAKFLAVKTYQKQQQQKKSFTHYSKKTSRARPLKKSFYLDFSYITSVYFGSIRLQNPSLN